MYAMMCNRMDVSVKYHVGSDALDGAIGTFIYWKTTRVTREIDNDHIRVGIDTDINSTRIRHGVLDNYVTTRFNTPPQP
jgi:hypothetical protein